MRPASARQFQWEKTWENADENRPIAAAREGEFRAICGTHLTNSRGDNVPLRCTLLTAFQGDLSSELN